MEMVFRTRKGPLKTLTFIINMTGAVFCRKEILDSCFHGNNPSEARLHRAGRKEGGNDI